MHILYPVRSPYFLYWPCKNRHKRCLFHRYARQRVFLLPKVGQLFCLQTRLWICGGTATGHIHFRNNETEGMLYQSNPVWVELFSYVHTFVGFVTYSENRNLGQRSEATHFLLWFIQQKTALVLVEENRILTACSQTTVFIYICMFKSAKTDCRVFKCH